jgi:hypothetical protein
MFLQLLLIPLPRENNSITLCVCNVIRLIPPRLRPHWIPPRLHDQCWLIYEIHSVSHPVVTMGSLFWRALVVGSVRREEQVEVKLFHAITLIGQDFAPFYRSEKWFTAQRTDAIDIGRYSQ